MYKKGDNAKPENYRPRSLLSPISKIFETILLKQMTTFSSRTNLSPNINIFSEKENGCAAMQLQISLITYGTDYIRDQKESGVSCFIDFQKASTQ